MGHRQTIVNRCTPPVECEDDALVDRREQVAVAVHGSLGSSGEAAPGHPSARLTDHLDVLVAVRRTRPDVDASDLLAAGAQALAYLLKDCVLGPAQLADAIRRVASGGPRSTRR